MVDRKIVKGHLFIAGAAVMWGLMAPLGKDAMSNGIGGFPMVGIRVLGGSACFWMASLFNKYVLKNRAEAGETPMDWRELLWLFGAGMFAIVFNQCNYIIGLSITSPLNASIMTTTMPIITMVLAAIVLKEPVTWKKLTGVMLGCLGATTIILASAGGTVGGVILGDIMCIGGQVSYSIYLTVFKKVIARHSPVTCQKWMMTSACLVIMPFCLPYLMRIDWAGLSAVTYYETAFVVVGGTFLSFLLSTYAQQILKPTIIAMYNYMQPIVACTVSVLLGLGRLSVFHLVAIVLVFVGVYLAQMGTSPSKQDA